MGQPDGEKPCNCKDRPPHSEAANDSVDRLQFVLHSESANDSVDQLQFVLHSESANDSVDQLQFVRSYMVLRITVTILKLIHATNEAIIKKTVLIPKLITQNSEYFIWLVITVFT